MMYSAECNGSWKRRRRRRRRRTRRRTTSLEQWNTSDITTAVTIMNKLL
ncbi:hypothetical protein LINPERPRIM_LOCUS13322 [Linum perenne]